MGWQRKQQQKKPRNLAALSPLMRKSHRHKDVSERCAREEIQDGLREIEERIILDEQEDTDC